MTARYSLPVLFVVVLSVGCKPKSNDTSPDGASPSPSASVAATPTRPPLPPEPPPSLPDKAAEVPDLEAKLAADKAYQALWTGPKADLQSFLSFVSELLAVGSSPNPLMKAVGAKKLQDAGIKLYLIFVRVGRFPDDFTSKLSAHLDATKAEPHLGVWSPSSSGGAFHDYSALAAWSRREDATYLREMIAAKKKGAGPFGWPKWTGEGEPKSPWLVDEVAALDRLEILTPLTGEELAWRETLRAVAKKEAAAKAEAASTLQVAAGELFSAYHENEVAADDRYKGKKLLVIGTVASIDKDFLDNINVQLRTSNQFMPVAATM